MKSLVRITQERVASEISTWEFINQVLVKAREVVIYLQSRSSVCAFDFFFLLIRYWIIEFVMCCNRPHEKLKTKKYYEQMIS